MHVYFIDFVLLDRSLLPSFDLQIILVIMKGELHMSGIWMWAEQRRVKAKGLKSSSPCDFCRRPPPKAMATQTN